jgi:GNAT superfamily N-acetyltransferase
LRDGTSVGVRPIRPDDDERLRAFHARLSPESIYRRFFASLPSLPLAQAERFTHVDYEGRMALVATTGSGADQAIIAVVRYEQIAAQCAEVAFVVEDRWQHRGIAGALIARLVDYARARGFTSLVAIALVDNLPMRALLSHAGYPHTARYADGCVEVHLDISVRPAPQADRVIGAGQ